MNRNPKTNCGSCVYYHPDPASDEIPGECRIRSQRRIIRVPANYWCGEYEPDLYVTHPETDHALEFKAAMMSPSAFWPPVPEEVPEPRCEGCDSSTAEDITLAPCPFASEIHNDETPVWLCANCRDGRLGDI